MQQRNFLKYQAPNTAQSHHIAPPSQMSSPTKSERLVRQGKPGKKDELTRIFNAAIISSQREEKQNFSSELHELTESVPFKAILNAVRQLSLAQGMGERQAAEQIVQTFKKMDRVWNKYVYQEGIEKIRRPQNERAGSPN